jgi:hypothetical protein
MTRRYSRSTTEPSFTVIAIGLALVFCTLVGGCVAYRGSVETVTFTVDHRERIVKGLGKDFQSYYLVWSREGEVYQVADSVAFLAWDSSDRYGKLREGSRVTATVAGWRVPVLSWYRNVVDVQDVRDMRTEADGSTVEARRSINR